MTVRSSTRGLPGLPRGRCGLSAFQASSDNQNKLFAMTIALQRLKSGANIQSKSINCMGSLPRSPTHKPEPYSDCGEFDEGEVVGVVLFIARRDGSEMLEFVEEAFDQVAEAIEIGAEGGDVHPAGHWLDVAPCALSRASLS